MKIFKLKKEKRVCFVHVPKCGGQSIKKAFQNSYKSKLKIMSIRARSSYVGSALNTGYQLSGDNEENLQKYREGLLRYFLADRDYGLVLGHYRGTTNTLDFFKDDWSFVTILRDPVDRFFSNYYFNRYKKSDHFKLNISLEEFIKTEQAIAWGNIYVRYFTENLEDYNSKVGIEEAKRTLKKYDVVGLLENMDDFVSQCSDIMKGGMKVESRNQNPVGKSDERRKVSDHVREKVIKLCRPSIQIYDFAKELNSKRK